MRTALKHRFSPLRDQRGLVSMIFILTSVSIFVALLSGIDLMRWSAVEARAQNALDAAVLAAGRNLGNLSSNPSNAQLAAWKADALGYFKANWPDDYLGSKIDTENVSIDVVYTPASGSTPAGQTISMSLKGSLPLMVSAYLGSAPLAIGAKNQALRVAKNNLEVVLVLDNTGSMAQSADGSGWGSSKMSALKTAAKTLISTLTPSKNSGVSAYFGLVPFTTTVNVRDANGHLPSNWLTQLIVNGKPLPATAPFTSNSWNGCMVEPPLSRPLSLQSPAAKPFHAYFDGWNVNYDNYARKWGYSGFQQSYCTSQPTTFLTTDSGTLTNAIDSMEANGSTFIASGVLWAWRMLSPAWRNADASKGWGSATLPQDSSPYLTKAMIIISDGDNVWQMPSSGFSAASMAQISYSNGNYNSNSNILGYPDYTYDWYGRAYGRNGAASFNGDFKSNLQPFGNVQPYADNPQSIAIVDAIQINACKQAAAAGVKIWGIVYGSGGSSHGMSVMRQCATQAAYYAPTDAELQKDFQSIAGQLSTLRLTK